MRVLVFVGPGIGHYTPLASYLRDCELDADILMVSELPADATLAKRIVADGYRYQQLQYAQKTPLASRVLHKALKRGLDRAIALSADHLPAHDLPHLVARTLFMVSSYTREIGLVSASRNEAVRALVHAFRPAIVFADTATCQPMAALMASENVPWVLHEVCPVNTVEPGRPRYPAGLASPPSGADALVNRVTAVASDLRDARIHTRLERITPGYAGHEHAQPVAKIAFTVAALDDFPESPQSEFSYVGVSPRELARVTVPPAPGGRKVVYVSLGSTGVPASRRLYETVIDGFRARHAHLILQIVDETIAAEIAAYAGPSGPSLEIKKAFTGHPADLLSRADLVIGHGGYRTVVEALSYGVPVLVIPNIAADRLEVARRVIDKGVGGSLNYHRVTPEDVAREAWRILDDVGVKTRAEQIRAHMMDTSERDRTIKIVRDTVQRRSRATAT
jgi:UDP:flavonoid glycosyltransferase YjiC (YdhE family)